MALAAALCATSIWAQEAPPNAPKFVKSIQLPGIEVRYLDFKWDPEAFAAIETGKGTNPVGRRSWALARLTLQQDPLHWEKRTIPVGPSIVILNPAQGNAPATLEVRSIDMRDIFVDMNVVAEPPPGDSYGKVPAVFAKTADTAARLVVSMTPRGNALDLKIHYGDRLATLTFTKD
jgi:hypothetical protein